MTNTKPHPGYPGEGGSQHFLQFLLAAAMFGVGCRNASTITPRSGEEAFQSCLLCHSTREMQRGPILDGLPAWYVELQLHKFNDGIRGSKPENRSEYLMASGLTSLQSTNEIGPVALHIATLPLRQHLKVIQGDKANGKTLYTRCLGCHGARAEGNRTLNSPPLNTIEDWFHLDQLIRFREGLRGYHTNDVGGHAMRIAVHGMTTKEFRDVVHFVTEEFQVATDDF